MPVVALVFAVIVMLVGVVGTLMPLLPGIPLIWLTQLAYGWYDGFQRITPGFLATGFVLMLGAYFLEQWAAAWGARRYGASRAGVWGAVIGTFVGLLALGPLGLLVGPFAGAALAELLSGRPAEQSIRSGFGSVLGMLGGRLISLVIAAGLVVSFLQRILGGG